MQDEVTAGEWRSGFSWSTGHRPDLLGPEGVLQAIRVEDAIPSLPVQGVGRCIEEDPQLQVAISRKYLHTPGEEHPPGPVNIDGPVHFQVALDADLPVGIQEGNT